MSNVAPALPFAVPRELCRDFARASRLEWLATNHTGAFAMGTVAGVNTRRYHGLLIASLHPPADRCSILPRVEESVFSNGARFDLATIQYPGSVSPRGFELLDGFALDPFPHWRYCCASTIIDKFVSLLDGQQAVLVRYETTASCRLQIRLFLSFRDYHSLTHKNDSLDGRVVEHSGSLSIQPYLNLPPLTVLHSGAFHLEPVWYRDHEYLRELERGLDFREDLFSPGFLEFEFEPQEPAWFTGTLEPQKGRRTRPPQAEGLPHMLDQFRITRADGRPSLVAGYPWFTDWSRDTLISLPALRVGGFPDRETSEILEMLLSERSQGLLPNRFADAGSAPEYNTADASLWLFVAAHNLIEHTNDLPFLRSVLYPAAMDILEWHSRGTQNDIHVDASDGLVWAGNPQTQLTWMDARVGGSPVTSRYGKPVEINALWYNALRITAHWSRMLRFSEASEGFEAEAGFVSESFRKQFWNPERNCLFDVVRSDEIDRSVRPNQLFAISLPFPLLDRDSARLVVDLVARELLTPVGLRTLAPSDPAYQPRFEGSMEQRDRAYHQGTVWPWLIGPFIDAYLYAYSESPFAVKFCWKLVRDLESQLSACCLGSLPEIYDADPPHRPGGCPAQLWSVAQLMLGLDRLSRFASH